MADLPKTSVRHRYALCVANDGCDDLRLRQVYRRLPDGRSERAGLVRIVDESGEDYLYPKRFFVTVTIPMASTTPSVLKLFKLDKVLKALPKGKAKFTRPKPPPIQSASCS